MHVHFEFKSVQNPLSGLVTFSECWEHLHDIALEKMQAAGLHASMCQITSGLVTKNCIE